MKKRLLSIGLLVTLFCFRALQTSAAQRYFAYEAVEDSHGVIAPWYKGLNGQLDFRARVAVETMKRYPWINNPKTGLPAPHYIYNGTWKIAPDGNITPGPPKDWANGDLSQRCAYAIMGLVSYYRYTGDPAAIAHISMMNDVILKHALTGPDHPWPRFLISVPSRGEMYGEANPHGMIQLDMVGLYGLALVQAYELTGNKEWLDAAKHWADVLAAKRNRTPGAPPWNRYANPEDVFWNDLQTGGVVMLLRFFDEVICAGYSGPDNSIVQAREAGCAYLRDTLLPRWLENDTWGRDYWDWEHAVQGEDFSTMVPQFMMAHPDWFPNWQTDSRNIMTLYIHRSCVSPKSDGDVYSGAWAYPEGCACCRRSLDYAPMQVGAAFAEYGVRANSAWAREMARRQFILATYDAHETGVVEDGMDGGQEVAGGWFQCAHALPLKYVLDGIGWLPVELGANRENHIVRSSSIVNHVSYERGRITYATFDAPKHTVDVLRLAFRPTRITANGRALKERTALDANGHATQLLRNGDCILTIRHDGRTRIVVEGNDPQTIDEIGLDLTCTFEGSQVRLIGSVGPDGGMADVYLDNVKQLCGIDFWNPYRLPRQVVFSRSGLMNGRHTVRVVVLGSGNPRSTGAKVVLDSVQSSAAAGNAGFGEDGGPTEPQRWIFGYPKREPYVDSAGNSWLPATEVVMRAGDRIDPVPLTWDTVPRRQLVKGTHDPELYRYGMHGTNFTANFTVGPGTYHVRIKLMESRTGDPEKRRMNIAINGELSVHDLDIAATAAITAPEMVLTDAERKKSFQGLNRAVDLVFNDIKPKNGIIAVRFTGVGSADAIVSAMEVGPGPGGRGAEPVSISTTN